MGLVGVVIGVVVVTMVLVVIGVLVEVVVVRVIVVLAITVVDSGILSVVDCPQKLGGRVGDEKPSDGLTTSLFD